MALLLVLLGVVLGLVVASSLLLRWNEVRYSRRRGLPPGTMGWPLFGETTEFLKQGPSFMKARRLRLVHTHLHHVSHVEMEWRAPPLLRVGEAEAEAFLCFSSQGSGLRGRERKSSLALCSVFPFCKAHAGS
jgi:hypothetical protein